MGNREEMERVDFEEWWAGCGKNNLPSEDDVPPKFFRYYKQIARMAWRECACRDNLKIHALKFQDHEIASFVNKLTAVAKEYGRCQCIRELISVEVKTKLKKQMS